jgi:haloalkane dehalogenase
MSAAEVIAAHERSGRRFTAAGMESFVLDQGSGETVLCMHGVPRHRSSIAR